MAQRGAPRPVAIAHDARAAQTGSPPSNETRSETSALKSKLVEQNLRNEALNAACGRMQAEVLLAKSAVRHAEQQTAVLRQRLRDQAAADAVEASRLHQALVHVERAAVDRAKADGDEIARLGAALSSAEEKMAGVQMSARTLQATCDALRRDLDVAVAEATARARADIAGAADQAELQRLRSILANSRYFRLRTRLLRMLRGENA